MFKIYSGGKAIAYCDKPRYIKKNPSSGSYIVADQAAAEGVVINGKIYSIPGKEPINGAEVAIISEGDISEEVIEIQNAAAESNAVNAIVFCTLAENETIDEVTAAEHSALFLDWTFPADYKSGQIRKYAEALYKCKQNHTSQEDWTPDATPALWRKIGDPQSEWNEWSQPLGAGDEYPAGAKVTHNNKKWISDIDGNIWEPGVYGWSEYIE